MVLNTLSNIDPILVRFAISEQEYLTVARRFLGDRSTVSNGEQAPPEGPPLQLILADGSIHDQPGKVVAVSQSINVETGTFSLEAAFANPDKVILPGQFARIRAQYETLSGAVVIPLAGNRARRRAGTDGRAACRHSASSLTNEAPLAARCPDSANLGLMHLSEYLDILLYLLMFDIVHTWLQNSPVFLLHC